MRSPKTNKPKETIPVVAPEAVPPVMEYLASKKKIEKFMARHVAVFKTFTGLIEEYNATLQNADKAVRAGEFECGPFKLYGIEHVVDAEKLYDQVGEEEFGKMGGTVKKVPVYEVDKTRILSLIQAEQLPEEVVKAVYQKKIKYSTPKPLGTP